MSNPSDFIIENGVLKKYQGPGGDVVIPEGVTEIGERAFYGCKGLGRIQISVCVTSIGYAAFARSDLVEIKIPDSVTSIGKAAFAYSDMLSVVFPSSVTMLEEQLFQSCKSLERVTIPGSVSIIGDMAFYDCSGLTELRISNGVAGIGNMAFSGCSSLTEVTIPEGVTSIGDQAFYECHKLASVTIPDSVTELGGSAFSKTKLEKDGRLYDNDVLYLGKHLINAQKRIRTCAIREGTLSICDFAFCNCSKLESITIPGSVKVIGWHAFGACHSLTSVTICKGVERIDSGAFEKCFALKSVSIPDTVTEIGSYSFSECGNLTDIVLPKSVKELGSRAFWNCGSLAEISIPEGQSIIGEGTFHNCSSLQSIKIPESVTVIKGGSAYQFGNTVTTGALEGCSSLTSLTLPAGVRVIEENALKNCSKLHWIKCPHVPGKNAAPGCSFALMLYGEEEKWLAFAAKAYKDNLSDFAKSGKWANYDLELINNGPKYKYKLSARLLGALGRLADPVELSEENRALLEELLNTNAKKLIALAEETGEAGIAQTLLSLGILDEKMLKTVKKLLAVSAVPELAALAGTDVEEKAAAPKDEKKAEATPTSPLQAEYAAKLKTINGDAVIKKMKLIGSAMPKVYLTDGTEAPEELFRFLLASYGTETEQGYRFDTDADAAAKLLSYDSLCTAMEAVSGNLDGPNYPAVLPLLCRYGNARHIRTLTNAWKDWEDYYRYGRKGRNARKILSEALVLSDTKEAAVWLEKNGSLKVYAALRGLTEAEVYEQKIFDFGFDENGKRVFDLGSTSVEVTLTPELKLALFDTAKAKTVKTIPKQDVAPAIQKKAADELTDMRQTLKRAVKIKNDQLFMDYLAATMFPAESWKRNYLENPFLHRVAELLVWSQNGKSFLLSTDGAIDSAGSPYTITDEPVRIAHPMELEASEVTAWQKHFTCHGLKQPFQQIWEPVYNPAILFEDRYRGCLIKPFFLQYQQKRGIETYRYEDFRVGYRYDFMIKGFSVTFDVRGDQKEFVELSSLRVENWNRQTNNVVAFLDRLTVAERIKNDDLRIAKLLPGFTLAQIMDFIHTAQEANAVNVLALLLDYKNAHFADFDPMDEFTLE